MMKNIENIKLKIIGSYILLFFIIMTLSKLNNNSTIMATREMLGGETSYSILGKTGFVTNIILLQYLNVDSIVYYLYNGAYINNRYSSKTRIYGKIITHILFTNIVLSLLLFLAAIFNMLVQQHMLGKIECFELAEVTARGLLTYFIFSTVQFILLMKVSQTNTFVIMTGIAIILCICIPFIHSPLLCTPLKLTGWELIVNIITCIVLSMCGIISSKIVFANREYRCDDY